MFSVVCTPAWPSRRLTTCTGTPASSNAEAWLCLNQCGVQPAGTCPPQPPHQVIDGLRPPRLEPRPTGQVHEDAGLIEISGCQVGPGLAQLPHVLAIEAVKLGGDIQPAVAAALDPHPMRMIPRNHLDERRVAAAGMPVAVLQPERLTKPQAAL